MCTNLLHIEAYGVEPGEELLAPKSEPLLLLTKLPNNQPNNQPFGQKGNHKQLHLNIGQIIYLKCLVWYLKSGCQWERQCHKSLQNPPYCDRKRWRRTLDVAHRSWHKLQTAFPRMLLQKVSTLLLACFRHLSHQMWPLQRVERVQKFFRQRTLPGINLKC